MIKKLHQIGMELRNTLVLREEGQTLAEYGLILALIAIAVIAAVTFLSGDISSVFSTIGDKL